MSLKAFDGVDKQRDGIANFNPRKDVLAILPTVFRKSFLFHLIPGPSVELYIPDAGVPDKTGTAF